MNKLDLTGITIGKLTVLEDVGRNAAKCVLWKCRCDCGGEVIIRAAEIKDGHVRSCGCLRSEVKKGNKYNLGKKRSVESRKKTRDALKGRVLSPAHCEKIRLSRTVEFREKAKQRMSGSGNPMFGKPTTEPVKEKLRAAMLGNTHMLGHKHSPGTILRMSEIRSGENHWNWKGGTTKDPYGKIFQNRTYRKFIHDRDGWKCQNPDCWHNSVRLCIHHINYDKNDCAQENLITLCTSCNMRANMCRQWHTEYYSQIMQMKQEVKLAS